MDGHDVEPSPPSTCAHTVVAGLVPAIASTIDGATDGRDKPGHDATTERRAKVIGLDCWHHPVVPTASSR
jgi:hypothetical protein